MMNVIVFLGSGVSYEALGDRGKVTEITKSIFQENYHDDYERSHDEPWPHVRKFLKVLLDYNKEIASRRKYPEDHQPNYEHLYHLCSQLRLVLLKYTDNAALWEFVTEVERRTASIFADLYNSLITYDLVDFSRLGCELIKKTVLQSLSFAGEDPEGFRFLRQLTRCEKFDNVQIVTLNHDDLIEKALSCSPSIGFADGFSEPDGNIRWYRPESLFTEEFRISLIKLHGSITWRHSVMEDRRIAIPLTHYDSCRDAQGRHIGLDKLPQVLTGSDKEITYHSGVFADMNYAFLKALYKTSCMIMSGYGWNDIGVNLRLKTWLDRDESRRLILLYENIDEIRIAFSINGNVGKSWNELHERGQLIPISRWFKDVEIGDDDIASAIFDQQ